jgi:threonyl-tRNA synthetase
VQVRVVPVGEKFVAWGREIEAALRQHMIRAEVDDSDHTMGKKIRNAATSKVPVVAIVGEREVEARAVTIRRYGIQRQEEMGIDAFVDLIRGEIQQRRHVRE